MVLPEIVWRKGGLQEKHGYKRKETQITWRNLQRRCICCFYIM